MILNSATDRIEASILKHAGVPTPDVAFAAHRVMDEVFKHKLPYVMFEPAWPAVSFFTLHISIMDIRDFQAKNRRMPFPTHSVTNNYVVNVPTSICVQAGNHPCVICAKPFVGGRMIQGCCPAHGSHVDCYGVAKVCHGGSRACFGGLFGDGECTSGARHHTSIDADQVEEVYTHVVDVMMRAPETESKADLINAAKTVCTWFPVYGASYVATGREMDAYNPRDKNKVCTVCAQSITDSGIVTCSAHRVHSSCYALWRSMRDRVGVEGKECPGKWMDGGSVCTHAGSCV